MNTTALSLLQRVRSLEDLQSWKKLDDVYRPLVKSWLQRQGIAVADTDDLTQDVMSTLVKELPSFQRERTGSFRKFLRLIILHRVQWHFREKKKDAVPLSFADLGSEDSQLSRTWEAEHDQFVLHRLLRLVQPEFEERTWAAFTGVVLKQQTPARVAAELAISVNAVLLAKSRILKRLREEAQDLIEV